MYYTLHLCKLFNVGDLAYVFGGHLDFILISNSYKTVIDDFIFN